MGGHEPRQSTEHDCLDAVFVALGHRHRRRVLSRLFERSPRSVDELLPEEPGGATDASSVAIQMHHRHLPKLAEAGFVEWATDGDGTGNGTVDRGPKFGELAPVIALMEEHGSELPGEWP